jgi:hypothetical protein
MRADPEKAGSRDQILPGHERDRQRPHRAESTVVWPMTGGCSPDQSSNPDSRVLLMRFIDEVQTRLWLEKYTIRFDQSGMPTFPASVSLLRSAVPSDSGRKTALSRTIATIFRKDDEALLWINEVGIWPSSEDLFLFQGFRRCLGEDYPLVTKPGHVFSQGDLLP